METKKYILEYYQDRKNEFRWKIKSKYNKKTVLSSCESFKSKYNAKRNLKVSFNALKDFCSGQ